MEKCRCGVIWKNSVAHYSLHGIEETLKLERELNEGTYKARKPKHFTITRPKKREAISIAFRDRVYQRSLNDNCIYPTMTRSFILDNTSCQRGKGTDFARERLDEFLHSYYRKHGLNGYALQCDIHGYYPNMSHSIAENLFLRELPPGVSEAAVAVSSGQYTGDTGYNPGSQMIQILGISFLNGLDHYIKEKLRVKYYVRYMDDFILIHEDSQYLEYCKKMISKYLKALMLEFNPNKTHVYPLSNGIPFLGFTHRLTKTGKVLRLISPKNIKDERRKLRKMVKRVQDGKMTKQKVDECYAAWKAHAMKGNTHRVIMRMDKYYKELWLNAGFSKENSHVNSGRAKSGRCCCKSSESRGDG